MPLTGEVIFWIVALIFFIVVEAVTVGLASIWFALGALAALICAALHAPVWLQVLWFLVISVATLFLTRPLVKKYAKGHTVATNADRNIGRVAVVTGEAFEAPNCIRFSYSTSNKMIIEGMAEVERALKRLK